MRIKIEPSLKRNQVELRLEPETSEEAEILRRVWDSLQKPGYVNLIWDGDSSIVVRKVKPWDDE